MFKTNFIIAWRNLWKHRMVSLINIGGLAIGIAICIIIMLFVTDEYSYDRYNTQAERIYRVILKGKVSDEIISEAVVPSPIAKTFQQEFPEVELGVRLKDSGTPKISYQSNSFRNGKLAYVDPEFFQVFDLAFVHGNSLSALKEPYSVVITSELAKQYFGQEDPMGKVLDFNEANSQYKVTGVIDKVPDNSHFHFDLFATTVGLDDAMDFAWIQSNGYSYLLLKPDAQASELERKIPELVEKYMGPQLQQALGMSMAEFKESGNDVGLYLQPLTDIHLRSDLSGELEPGGSIKTVYIFSGVALFILIIACINFMNLSTSLATRRAKEVGVKKVLGGLKNQLIGQFLLESSLTTAIALLVALLLVVVLLPYFNLIAGKSLQVGMIVSPQTVIAIAVFGFITGILSGAYPAFVMSSFKPISALKDRVYGISNRQGIRSGLVVLQFAISVTLIITTVIADLQISYILNKDLGYNKDRIVVIRNSWMLGDKELVLKEQLESDSRVAGITRSGYIPAGASNTSMYNIYPNAQSDDFRRMSLYHVDHQYLETMGMELVSGQNFSKDQESDSSSTIINETAARLLNLSNPVGQVITMGANIEGDEVDLTIIGVVKDFHFSTLYQPIEPLFMLNNPNSGLIIRSTSSDLSGLIFNIQSHWDAFNIGEPFSYTVLNESYRNTYAAETNLGTVLRVLTVLTIAVALIGLFGLVTFTTEQRVKEIGIRKVLGSSVAQIVSMLARDFIKLICISFLLAFPVGLFLAKRWLQDFAYRIDIPWWVFMMAALLTLLMAAATISIKSIRAALANPVDALRNE